jgi:hypothetical protein
MKFMQMTQFDGLLIIYAKWWGWTYMWARVKNQTLKLEPCVHTLKFKEIRWNLCRWFNLVAGYLVQSGGARLISGPHVKNRTLKLKSRVHTFKFQRNWLNFIEMTQFVRMLLSAKWCTWTYMWASCQELDHKNPLPTHPNPHSCYTQPAQRIRY